jgi:hypothetical protein
MSTTGNGNEEERVPNPASQSLDAVLREVPKGALALAGLALAILLIAWLLMYLLVFIPRGTVG